MANTSLSDQYSNLCRDYSSFIKWGIDKISKNTTKWTDYSISEPDTLMLSSISIMHDYSQYVIDQLYLNTDLDVCSLKFLHQVSAAMGNYLNGTNPIKIPIKITNNTPNFCTIDPYEIFVCDNELFTNPEKINIPANSSTESFVVRNVMNNIIYSLNDSSKGEFRLNGNIEKASINVSGITSDGSIELLPKCDYIFDLLFDNSTCQYLITSIDYTSLRIKISPKTLKNYTALLVQYTISDDYPIKSGLQLNSLKYPEILVETIDNVSINSEIPINNEKLNYLNSLEYVRTLCNIPYDLQLGELTNKINNYNLKYNTNSSIIIPLFEYTTYNDKALSGSGGTGVPTNYLEEYFYSLDYNTKSQKLTITFDSVPQYYNLIITYNLDTTIVVTKDQLLNNLQININNQKYISVILQDYDNNSDLSIGFANLGYFIKYNAQSQNKMEYLSSELQILLNKFAKNLLIKHRFPQIKFLEPLYLDLSSNITLIQSYDPLEIITKIITLLNNIIIGNQIVNDTIISYRRLEILIQNNIEEIIDIEFTNPNKKVYINADRHLALKSPEQYLSSIKFRTEGDDNS